MEVTKRLEWDMGHRVPNHKSKCRNVHGHRYAVEITLEGEIIDEENVSDEGMVIDFGDIKIIAKDFIDTKLDHGYMGYYHADEKLFAVLKEMDSKYIMVDFIPTAEHIAAWLFHHLSPLFTQKYENHLRLKKIRLWETPTSYVDYFDDNGIKDEILQKPYSNIPRVVDTPFQQVTPHLVINTPLVKKEIPDIIASDENIT